MKLNRRELLKSAAIGSAMAALPLQSKKAMAANITQLLRIDPITLSYAVGSTCCWYCPNNYHVFHYQPVALVEVLRGPGDSILSNAAGITSPTDSARDQESLFVGDVRIWELTDFLIDPAVAYQGCKLHGVDHVKTNMNNLTSTVAGMSNLCGAASGTVMSALTDVVNDFIDLCYVPKMVYDSTLDPAWDTGCGDWSLAAVTGPACEFENGISNIGDLISGSMTGMLTGKPATVCVGEWGSVYPRQQAYNHTDPRIGAAMTAYRAIHKAYEIGTFLFNPEALFCKLQQVAPVSQVGMPAGTPFSTSTLSATPAAVDGKYAYVWYVPASGCKSYNEIAGLCTPEMCIV